MIKPYDSIGPNHPFISIARTVRRLPEKKKKK